MSRFLNGCFQGLSPYVPGEQPQDKSYIKLNTNESPYPPSPAVVEAITKGEIEALRLYGDPDCAALKRALAERLGTGTENIFVGNGSDEVLSFIFMGFCGERGASFPDISYGFYPVYAQLYGIRSRQVPLRGDFSLCPEDYCVDDSTVVIANPNAPTGLCISPERVEDMLKSRSDRLVVVDEAYVDFGGESCAELTRSYDNLIVVQTFSKSRSLAGARLGFAVANGELISDLERLRCSTNPYNINRLTMLAGEAALKSQGYYDANVKRIVSTRQETAGCLRDMGFELTDSRANFLFARHPGIGGEKLYLDLKERGILVRHFSKPRIDSYVRITVGDAEQMKALCRALKEMTDNA